MTTKTITNPLFDLGHRYASVWAFYLLAALVVWISADLSRFLSIPSSTDTSAIWPPLGVALAAGWVYGRSWIPVYATLIGVWFYVNGYSLAICALFALEQGVELFAMMALQRRFVREPDFLSTLTGALRFYLFATVIALLPPAGALTLAYHQLGYFADQPFVGIWMLQWLPEAMGVALFAPPAQRFFNWWRSPTPIQLDRWATLFVVLFAVLLAASLGETMFDKYNYARGLAYLFFPLLIACALRGHSRTALWLLPIAAACTLANVYLGTWATNTQAWNALGEAVTFAGVLAIMTQLVLASSTERMGLIKSLRESSRRDALTGEFNHRGLLEQVQRKPQADDQRYVCVALTLRNFSHSHELLPRLIVDACERWVLRQMRTLLARDANDLALARLEKGLYCAVITGSDGAWLRPRLLELDALIRAKSFQAADWDYRLEPAVGAIPFEDHGYLDDVVTATCYRARDTARNVAESISIGTDYGQLLESERNELRKVEQLKAALNGDGFKLFGQIIQPLRHDSRRAKIEFLLRMQGPDGEWIAPGAFMSAANRFGYMIDIDRWVIRHAFAEVAARPDLRERIAQFSINLSGASLGDETIRADIETEIARSGLAAPLFCFEITETETIADWNKAFRVIQYLKSLGFDISLDDFGTGLASFDYLNRFDFDYVKIDGSFIRTLDRDSGNREVVEAIVLVARRRSIRTIAEFVENDAVAAQLLELGVDYVQGFGIHRPAPLGSID